MGCGYLGMRVARIWQAKNDPIFALTRKSERSERFRREGWTPLLGDLCGELPTWPEVDTVLLAVGFDRSSDYSIDEVYVGGVRRLIETLPDSLRRLIYISSTGVYGSVREEVVDEGTECRPDRPGGKACLEAERLLRESRFGSRTIILRLAGIYGPDRVPRLKTLRDGEPIAADPNGQLNLIHVDDAAAVVVAVADHTAPAPMYCVSDNAPGRRGDFLRLAAEQLDLPEPTFDLEAATGPGNRRGGNKRVDSSKLLAEIPVTLQFPSYQVGLPDAISRSHTDR